ncbi:DUF982 domain-containing protein [Rhizobium viscosum]|uniref:DUF982 domain-containing protein n=1 Tax=Rhizobium viscosum TaxID=1673 RepID=UPI001789E8A4
MSGHERYRLVRSFDEVGEALTGAWPTDDGKEYIAGVRSCRDAIHGNIPAKMTRAALLLAAEEDRKLPSKDNAARSGRRAPHRLSLWPRPSGASSVSSQSSFNSALPARQIGSRQTDRTARRAGPHR